METTRELYLRARYAALYDVPGKVARAKAAGELAAILDGCCPFCRCELAPLPPQSSRANSRIEAIKATLPG